MNELKNQIVLFELAHEKETDCLAAGAFRCTSSLRFLARGSLLHRRRFLSLGKVASSSTALLSFKRAILGRHSNHSELGVRAIKIGLHSVQLCAGGGSLFHDWNQSTAVYLTRPRHSFSIMRNLIPFCCFAAPWARTGVYELQYYRGRRAWWLTVR